MLTEQQFLANYDARDYPAPLVTVDVAIFAIEQQQLHILLTERATHPAYGQWALPGGFVDIERDKDLTATAYRKLQEKTGVCDAHLEQVCTQGNDHRDPRGWALTVLYFALINYQALPDPASLHVSASRWQPVASLDECPLAFDHSLLVELARQRLLNKSEYTALPLCLMPERFTLTEAQHVFETLLTRRLEKKSFRRRLEQSGLVVGTGEQRQAGKRYAQLYKLAPGAMQRLAEFTFPRAI